MADENKEKEAAAAPAGKKPIKTMIAVAAMLVIEAVAIVGIVMLSKGPKPIAADTVAIDMAAESENAMEMLLVQDKFQNTRTGKAYLYDAAIYIVIKKKNESEVISRIEESKARIEADISNIYRKAEPAHLMEFELSTLKRQVKAALDNRIGIDAADEKPLVQEVVMRQKRYRAD